MSKKRILSIALSMLMLVNVFYGIPMMKVAAEANTSWESCIFGNSVSTATNKIMVNNDKTVTIESTKGKISNSADGIAYYYSTIDVSNPIQLTAKVHVNSFTAGDNQVSFGLMIRNKIGANAATAGHTSNFVAVGVLNQKIQAFSRSVTASEADSSAKLDTPINLDSTVIPKAGDDYTLSISRVASSNECIVTFGSQSAVIPAKDIFSNDKIYIGLFVARNAKVTFSDIKLISDVKSIEITAKPTKNDYTVGQDIDLNGMVVSATGIDGSKKTLSSNDYIISGYDKNKEGTQVITVLYGGQSATFSVNVKTLSLTGLQIVNTPAKTTYYLDDKFDTLGMVVSSVYNNGDTKVLTPADYTITGFDSSKSGENTINVSLNSDPTVKTSFNVTIKNISIQGLEITRQPSKNNYYIGDTLDLKGLVISALYSDGKQLLQPTEYTVDAGGFDTLTAAIKYVTVSYKGKSTKLQFNVKEKQYTNLEVTNLPKTTMFVGEDFAAAGIVVSKVFDNSSREALASTEYSIDTSAYKKDAAGVYSIGIVPKNQSLKGITFPVTVREKTTYTWKSIVFGQSTSSKVNKVEPSKSGTIDGTITLKAGSLTDGTAGGKITGAHDGISFYYTEIDGKKDNFELSADVKVIEFAKETPDKQEAFGLMARDAIGKNGDSAVFSSNVVGVGGYEGKTQAFIRTGVTSSLGNEGTVQTKTSWNTERPNVNNTNPVKTYRLSLKKTNSGYEASLNDTESTKVLFYQPDALIVQDSKIYVGFYTARVATIEVSNVKFNVTDAATDAAKIEAPPVPATPTINVVSLVGTSKTDYNLKLLPSVNGTVTIKQGEKVIANDMPVKAKEVFSQNTKIAESAVTNFTITYTPDPSQVLTSYDRIVSNFAVTNKVFNTADGAIFVSPQGKSSSSGTKAEPLDLDTALQYVKEGQTIYLLGGTYNRTTPIIIPVGNDGTAAALKTLSAYNGETVIFDFGGKSKGFTLAANYWHIVGIDFAKSANEGVQIGGSNNIIELCKAYESAGTGMQISRVGSVTREFWPANNLILNCEVYDCKDPAENNADGFGAKLTCGEGNVFRGCISHNNIDDGWDLYTKAESGPIGAVVLEDCIAYNNGTLTNGYVGKGDKNGFKLGGEGIAVPHIIRNSIAFGNGASGFTSNSNPAVQAYNCVSYDNKSANISFSSYAGIPVTFKIDGFVSYRSKSGPVDSYPETAKSKTNFFYTGTASINNSWETLKDTDFASLAASLPYKRDVKGNIIKGEFLKFTLPSGEIGKVALKDINGHWAEKNITSLVSTGVVKGYSDGTFNPDALITRGEFAAILVKAFHFAPQLGKGFSDTKNHWANDYISTAVINKLVKGYDDSNFGADDYITREQMALMVMNAVKLNIPSGTVSFKDNSAISDWAKDAVAKATTAGIIKGYGDNTFKPQENATRAEAVTVIWNAISEEIAQKYGLEKPSK